VNDDLAPLAVIELTSVEGPAAAFVETILVLEGGMELHQDVARLSAILGKLVELLAANDAAFWANKIQKCQSAVANSDASGLQRFRGFFGGMGSLNDLILQRGGSPLRRENDELRALLSEGWILADELARGSHNVRNKKQRSEVRFAPFKDVSIRATSCRH
jgi:hypothetical protein